jgi:hypothetical protein
LQRLLVALAALLLIVPDGLDSRILGNVATDLLGLILAVCTIAWLWWRARRIGPVAA